MDYWNQLSLVQQVLVSGGALLLGKIAWNSLAQFGSLSFSFLLMLSFSTSFPNLVFDCSRVQRRLASAQAKKRQQQAVSVSTSTLFCLVALLVLAL